MEGVFVPLSIKVWCRMADVDDDDLRDSAGSRLTSKASVDEQLPPKTMIMTSRIG